jgi:hypothetical protein
MAVRLTGIIANMQNDLALVDRMRDALYGEQLRRQERGSRTPARGL